MVALEHILYKLFCTRVKDGLLVCCLNDAIQREHDLIGVGPWRSSDVALLLLNIDSNHSLCLVEVQGSGGLRGWSHPQMHLDSALTFPVRHRSSEV